MIIKIGNLYLTSDLSLSAEGDEFVAINYRKNGHITFKIMNKEGKYLMLDRSYLLFTREEKMALKFSYNGIYLSTYIDSADNVFYVTHKNNKMTLSRNKINVSIVFSSVDINYLGSGVYGIIYRINKDEVAKIYKYGDKDAREDYNLINVFPSSFNHFLLLPKRIENSPLTIFSRVEVVYPFVHDMYTFIKTDEKDSLFLIKNIIRGTYALAERNFLNLDLKLDNIGNDNGVYKMFDLLLYKEGQNIDLNTGLYHPQIVAKIMRVDDFFINVEDYNKKYFYVTQRRIRQILLKEVNTFSSFNDQLYQRLHLFMFTVGVLLPLIWNLEMEFNYRQMDRLADFVHLTCVQGDFCPTLTEVFDYYDEFLLTL
jgi:hypothetical protein